jgi:WD40 repeat protein
MPHLEPSLAEPGPIWQAAEAYADRFRDNPGDLESLLAFVIDRSQTPGLIVLIDQLEELFSQVPEPDRAAFVDLLSTVCHACHIPAKWLLTLRADFMERAVQFDRLRAMLQDATVLLGPMNEQELQAAIVEPAEMLGVRFEAGLPERLVQDAIATDPHTEGDGVGTLAGRLPLLEFALTELWMRQKGGVIAHAVYDDPVTGIGGIEGALRQHAERVYVHYDSDRQARTRRLFRRLVERGPGLTDVRRLVPRDEVAADWDDLVADLAKQRLVTTSESATGQATVEVIHEALLRAWPDLRNWISEHREFDLWRQGLGEQATTWDRAGPSAKADLLLRGTLLDKALVNRRERAEELIPVETRFIEASLSARRLAARQRTMLVAAAFAVVVSVAAVAGWQWWRAESQRAIAEQQKEAAERASVTARRERERAEEQRQRALARALAAEATQLVERGRETAAEFRAAALAVESWKRMSNADAHAVAVNLMKRSLVSRYAVPQHHGFDQINSVAFSADGRYVAVGRMRDGVRLIDMVTGVERAHIRSDEQGPHTLLSLKFSPDASVLMSYISERDEKKFNLIRAATGEVIFSASAGKVVRSQYAFSADSRYFAYMSDTAIHLIELDSGRELFQVENPRNIELLLSPDSAMLATLEYDPDIPHVLIDVPSGHERARIEGTTAPLDAGFSDDGKFLCLLGEDPDDKRNRALWIVDTETGVKTATVPIGPEGRFADSVVTDVVAIEEATNNRVRLIYLPDGEERYRSEGNAEVGSINLFDDGRKLLVWRRPNTIDIIDTRSGRQVRRIDFEKAIEEIFVAPRDAFFVVSGENGVTATYSGETGDQYSRFEPIGSIVGLTPDRELLVTAERQTNRLSFYDTLSGREAANVEYHGGSAIMEGPVFGGNGRFLTLGGSPLGDLLVFDTRGIGGPAWLEQAKASLQLSPDGTNVAILRHDGGVAVVRTNTRQPLLVIPPTPGVTSTAFSPDGRFLVAWNKDSARLFEVASGRQRADIPTNSPVRDVKFSVDSRVLTLAGQDGWVRIVDTASGRVVSEFRVLGLAGQDRWVRVFERATRSGRVVSESRQEIEMPGIVFSPDGRLLAVIGNEDRTCRVIDALTGAERFNIELDAVPWSVAFSPDGATLAVGIWGDDTTRLLDATSGAERFRLKHKIAPNVQATHEAVFAPDSQTLAVIHQNDNWLDAWLFDLENGKEQARVDAGKSDWTDPGDDGDYPLLMHHAVAFSGDGRHFAVGSVGGGLARLLETSTGREVLRTDLGEGYVGVAFSPDGRYLAAASRNGTVGLASIEEKRQIAGWRHGAGVMTLQFSPDSRLLATASEDGTVQFTNTRDGRALARFEHDASVDHIGFSPDGRWLATQSGGVARLFRANPGWSIEQLCARTGVNLSRSEWESVIGPEEPWRPTCPNWRNPDPDAASPAGE